MGYGALETSNVPRGLARRLPRVSFSVAPSSSILAQRDRFHSVSMVLLYRYQVCSFFQWNIVNTQNPERVRGIPQCFDFFQQVGMVTLG
jgi:hypothetical protein